MNENDRYKSGLGGSANPSSGERDRAAIQDRIQAEKQSMSGAVSNASESVTAEAKSLGRQAQHAAEGQADKLKEATASHLDGFADALRAASDELSHNQTGPAAEMVASAASGLEGLSRSLHGKKTGEMVDTIRQFGRENPMAFLAGSVLAGFALGRFAAVGTQQTSSSSAGQTSSVRTGQQAGSSYSTPAYPGQDRGGLNR